MYPLKNITRRQYISPELASSCCCQYIVLYQCSQLYYQQQDYQFQQCARVVLAYQSIYYILIAICRKKRRLLFFIMRRSTSSRMNQSTSQLKKLHAFTSKNTIFFTHACANQNNQNLRVFLWHSQKTKKKYPSSIIVVNQSILDSSFRDVKGS